MADKTLLAQFAHELFTVTLTLATWGLAQLGILIQRRREKRFSPMLHETSEIGVAIRILLAELGVELDACRAFLAQYHNGDHYVSGSSLLRKSRTHEWTAINVNPNAQHHQNVLISLYHEECEMVEEAGPSFRQTSDIPQGTFRRMLEGEGVRAIARCAVRFRGDIIGFIGLEFLERAAPPANIELLPFFAARIEQVLSSERHGK